MKIIETKIMLGPNYWSSYRKHLIVLRLDIEELEKFPTNKIEGFSDRLEKLFPSLYSHYCSEGVPGGFFKRVQQGTWMGHVVEHIALELQTLAGMNCGFGRTRSTDVKGVYHVVFAYEIKQAGLYAATAAIRIADALVKGENYDVDKDLEELRFLKEKYSLGPSTLSIVKAAEQHNIPYKRLDSESLITLGYGIKQKKLCATISDCTSCIGVEIAGDKNETKKILAQAHIPVPSGFLTDDVEELKELIKEIQFPLVIKPIDGNHGRGITTNITTIEQAVTAFQLASSVSPQVIIEEFIEGFDYRFLLINYKLVAIAQRTPAMIIGDGISSIQELINSVNRNDNRGEKHEKILTKIKADEITIAILNRKNLTLESVLPLGEKLFLKDTANISTGGTATDVTELAHPHNVFLAERIARMLNLNICGIDVVAKRIDVPITRDVGGVVEVNASPGLRMHLNPTEGIARNVAEPIVNMLFPKGNGRIPIVAITGTNGKTTTTRLIAHLAKHSGHKVGYTTTDGIYIQDYMVHKGDCTGPLSSETVLFDPTIDFAVLECARGGILRSGLAFDKCDISVITNVTADHIGLDGIDTVEKMADVKSVIAKSTSDNGYAILNADDDLVYAMRRDVSCNVALFSMNKYSDRIKKHCEDGGIAAVIEDEYLTIYNGEWKTRIEKIVDIPLTFEGRAESMIKNLLPAVLAGYIQGFSLENIRAGLKSFIPSASQTPGRMNLFSFKNFDFMVDYVHNIDGFLELKKFLDKTPASEKVGIIGVPGDRRDEDILKIGQLSGQIFNQIIIRHDKDLRGRTKDEISALLIKGIHRAKPDMPIKIISEANRAMQYAIDNAKDNAFILISTESVYESIEYVSTAQKLEEYQTKTQLKPHAKELLLQAV
jgi:cyanophycin synthetase